MKRTILIGFILFFATALVVSGCSIKTSDELAAAAAASENVEEDDSSLFGSGDEEVQDDEDIDVDLDEGADEDVVEDDDADDDDDDSDDVDVEELVIEGDENIPAKVDEAFTERLYKVNDGVGNSYEWDLEGQPDWVEFEPLGSWKLKVNGTPPADAVDQSFTFTITATDEDNPESLGSIEVTIEVTEDPIIIEIEEPEEETFEEKCQVPLSIEIVKNGNLDKTLENEVQMDTPGHEIVIRVTRDGEQPMGEIQWTFSSEVDDSFFCDRGPDALCWHNGPGCPDSTGSIADPTFYMRNGHLLNKISEWRYYYPVPSEYDSGYSDDKCLHHYVDEETDEVIANDPNFYHSTIGRMVGNASWKFVGDAAVSNQTAGSVGIVTTSSDELAIKGDFNNTVYDATDGHWMGSLPWMKRENTTELIDRLTITVQDDCKYYGKLDEVEMVFRLQKKN